MTVHPLSHTPGMGATEAAVEDRLSALGRVEAWRLECLLRAGWEMEHAEVIAVSNVDLHVACRIVQEEGCSSELAFSILA